MSNKIERLYNLKIVKSGKRLEVFKYSLPIKNGIESKNKNGRKGKSEISDEQKKLNKENRRKQTLYNSRNNIIRLISSNQDLQMFITLTYKENIQDISLSKKHLKLLFKKLKRYYGDIKYLYVFELQKRGAIHYHMLTNLNLLCDEFDIKTSKSNHKKSDQQKELENKFRNKFWKYGFVDIRNLKSEGNSNIAKYVASYLVQDLLDLEMNGNRIYGYSAKTLDKPKFEKLETKDNIESLIQLDNYDLKFVNSYEIRYINKLHQEVKGLVNYFDYQRK